MIARRTKINSGKQIRWNTPILLSAAILIGTVSLLFMLVGQKSSDAEYAPVKQKRIIKTPPIASNSVATKIDPSQNDEPPANNQVPESGRLEDGRWMVPGRKKIHNVVTNYSNTAEVVAYRNGPEQVLLGIFSRQRGDMPTGLPTLSAKERENLASILMDTMEPDEKDSDWIAEDKEIINIAKAELRKYVKDGGDVDSFLEYYHKELVRSYYERKEAIKAVFEVCKTQDAEFAIEYCDAVNKKLAEKGIKPINPPMKILENK